MSSIREQAGKLATEHTGDAGYERERRQLLAEAVEKALRDERERCAKILDKRIVDLKSVRHPTNHNIASQSDLIELAAAIRKDEV